MFTPEKSCLHFLCAVGKGLSMLQLNAQLSSLLPFAADSTDSRHFAAAPLQTVKLSMAVESKAVKVHKQ